MVSNLDVKNMDLEDLKKLGIYTETQREEYLKYNDTNISKEELEDTITSDVTDSIFKEIQDLIRERKSYDEESITELDDNKEALIFDLALNYFHNSELHYSASLPISRAKAATQKAFINTIYDKNLIQKTINEDFKTLKELFHLSNNFNEEAMKNFIVNSIEKIRENGLYFDFFERSILWYASETIFDVISETYGVEIEYSEGPQFNKNEQPNEMEQFNELENKVLELFEKVANYYHDGFYSMSFNNFPKKVINDVCELINEENPIDKDVKNAFSLFVENLFFSNYPELKKSETEVKEVLNLVLINSNEVDAVIINESNVNSLNKNDIKIQIAIIIFNLVKTKNTTEYKIPCSLLVNIENYYNNYYTNSNERNLYDAVLLFFTKEVIESNEILILSQSTPFTLGKVTDLSLTYSAKGYPFVLGFVGNELFLSSKDVPIDFKTLKEIKKKHSVYIPIQNNVYKCMFKKI